MRYGLKERLLGAGILIALAVIFIPFLFETDTQTTAAVKIETPPPPPKVQVEVAKPIAPEIPQELPLAEQEIIQQHNATSASGLKLKVEGGAEAWAIQVASFGDSGNAKRLVKQLTDQNLHAYWRKINSMAVVFVGPYLSRQLAQQDQALLLQKNNLKTLITSYVPDFEAKIQGSLPSSDD